MFCSSASSVTPWPVATLSCYKPQSGWCWSTLWLWRCSMLRFQATRILSRIPLAFHQNLLLPWWTQKIFTKLNPESILILIIILGILPGLGGGGEVWKKVTFFIRGKWVPWFCSIIFATHFGKSETNVISALAMRQVENTPQCQYKLSVISSLWLSF